MKSTNFRIGNLVNSELFGISKIINIGSIEQGSKIWGRSLSGCFWDNEYSPIEITEDWLIDLGFKDLSSVNNKMAYRLDVNSVDELCWYKQDNNVRYQTKASGFTRDFNIKYVHQLQNLYFALTGDELVLSES
jgi:hypothetical protein